MLLLRIPAAIGNEYNAAIEKLIVTYINNLGKIDQHEYDKLCAKLLALEVVILHHFFEAEPKDLQDYLTKIDGLLGNTYQGLFGGSMACGPLYPCGNRCCFGAEGNI